MARGEGASSGPARPSSRPRIQLEVVAGEEKGRCMPVMDDEVQVGRGTGRDQGTWLHVADVTVSRHHATLKWDEKQRQYALLNRSQTNLTQVNGLTVNETHLRAGDTVRLGNLLLSVRAGPREAPHASAREAPASEAATVLIPLPGRGPARWGSGRHRLKRSDLAQFFGQVGMMLDVGIPLARALQSLSQMGATPGLRQVCGELLTSIQGGTALSAAMRAVPGAFSELHVHSVQSGETSGQLPAVLKELGFWEERDLSLARAVSSSLTYPITVFICGVLLVAFLGNRVFATLVPTLERAGASLPLVTRILVAITHLLERPLVLIPLIAIVAGAAWLLWQWARSEGGRLIVDRVSVKLPLFGPLVRKLFVVRFCNHLSLLYQAGIPLLQALETATAISTNTWIRRFVRDATVRLRHGESLAESLRLTDQFPKLVIAMVMTGESTNELGPMLGRLSGLYDLEVHDTLQRMVKLLEPMIILGMGFVVGFIILATLLPMYQLITTF